MLKTLNYARDNAFALVVGILLCIAYLHFYGFRAAIEFDLETESAHPSVFKVYWAGDDALYTENNMQQILITRYRKRYGMFLANLGDISRLRIDPIEYKGNLKLASVSVRQRGFETINLNTEQGLALLKPIQQIGSLDYHSGALILVTSGNDGQLELTVNPVRTRFFAVGHVFSMALIMLLVLITRKLASFLYKDYLFVPCFLLLAFLMVFVMAVLTGTDTHPDEYVHVNAVSFYGDYWLPPPIDSDRARDTFSVYGYSRLANYELYYQVAGYFTRAIAPFHLSELLNIRIFGLFILALLTLVTIVNHNFRLFALPLLVSAQTWYLFSYANSDGFALIVATIMSYQAAYKDSYFNRFLRLSTPPKYWITLGLFGLAVGVMLLLKENFYFFILFLGLYVLWRIAIGDLPNQKSLWVRLILIAIIGLAIYGVRFGLDYAANGSDRKALYTEMAERHAKVIYKPSTPLEHKHIYLYLKARGFSLDRIIQKEQWDRKTFITAFGAYGYTQYFSSQTFYDLVRNIGLTILGLMLLGILIKGPPSVQVLFSMVGLCAVMLIGLLLWRSWTVSFQPQGRYLAPILPMFGILYYHIRHYIYDKAVIALTVCLFVLSVYSFVFVGLYEIRKASFFT